MRNEKVRVHSAVDNRVLRHISEREARLMCAEDFEGNKIEGMEPVAFRVTRKKHKLGDIRLLSPKREERSSPCTLTLCDMERNGLQNVFRTLDKSTSIASMLYAEGKVKAWPNVYDKKNVGICAGKMINPTLMDSIPETMVNFA